MRVSTYSNRKFAVLSSWFCFLKGFEPNTELTDDYKAKALDKLEERMMYGGRRLAELIKEIYFEATQEEQVFLNWSAKLFSLALILCAYP